MVAERSQGQIVVASSPTRDLNQGEQAGDRNQVNAGRSPFHSQTPSTLSRSSGCRLAPRRRRLCHLIIGGKLQHVHRTHVDADSALNAGGIAVVERFLILGERDHIDTHLAVLAALGAGHWREGCPKPQKDKVVSRRAERTRNPACPDAEPPTSSVANRILKTSSAVSVPIKPSRQKAGVCMMPTNPHRFRADLILSLAGDGESSPPTAASNLVRMDTVVAGVSFKSRRR